MPARRQRQTNISEVVLLARPKKPMKFYADNKGGIVILRGEDGAIAVVPEDEVCRLAERLNLIIVGYNCKKRG
ncbi:hypothetical protein [Pyrodictium delaneyi]|nr:hypothetical protein [Pyrodictium delaneyi]